MNRPSIDDMQVLARLYDGECLSEEYKDSHTKLIWKCSLGHQWQASPTNIKQGKWCPFCAGRHQTIEDMRSLARLYSGECLSSAYRSAKVKLQWKCKHGHVWEAAPYVMRRGSWCKKCATATVADRQRGNIEECKRIAKQRRGKCLSTEYVNIMTKLEWQCDKGHVWEAVPNNIRNGQWCPICGIEKRAATQRGSIEEMRKIAEDRGGRCLSNKYINSTTTLRWQCSEGHTWEARPGNIKFGQWCPICARRKIKSGKSVEQGAAPDGYSAG